MPDEQVDQVEEAAELAELPNTVVLHGAEGPLRMRVVVPRLALRFELAYAADIPNRAYAAALHRCCSAVRKHVRDDASVSRLGLAVIEWALEAGVPYLDVIQAGEVAWLHCVRGLPNLGAAKSTAGFSDPTEAASSG